jgi:hypothetical protein
MYDKLIKLITEIRVSQPSDQKKKYLSFTDSRGNKTGDYARTLYRKAFRHMEHKGREAIVNSKYHRPQAARGNFDDMLKANDVVSYAKDNMNISPKREQRRNIKHIIDKSKGKKDRSARAAKKYKYGKAPGMYANEWYVNLGKLILEGSMGQRRLTRKAAGKFKKNSAKYGVYPTRKGALTVGSVHAARKKATATGNTSLENQIAKFKDSNRIAKVVQEYPGTVKGVIKNEKRGKGKISNKLARDYDNAHGGP